MTEILLDQARDAGFSPDKLRAAFALLEGWTDEGVLPGAVALVTRGDTVAGEAYVGLADRQSGRLVDAQTIWSLASVTKPFTATAVMLLVEAGQFSLDEPLVRLLPEFARGATSEFDRETVTLRHVLAHCSGLPGFSPDNLALRQAHRPLEDFVQSFGCQALYFAPGTAHLYSNPGILLAAEVVGRALSGTLGQEVGQPQVGHYHGFVHERILAPLGMASSSLKPPGGWNDRIAIVERTGQEGTTYEGGNSAYYRSLGIPWGGMFSTPRDLIRFVQEFLAESPTIVSPATAEAMTTVQFGPPDASPEIAPDLRDSGARTPPLAKVEWGIGWDIKGSKRGHRSGDLTSEVTYGHAGATGTMVWADPAVGVACVLLTNRTLSSGWTTERPRQALFSNAVMAAAL